jgi:hypothetical protein
MLQIKLYSPVLRKKNYFVLFLFSYLAADWKYILCYISCSNFSALSQQLLKVHELCCILLNSVCSSDFIKRLYYI